MVAKRYIGSFVFSSVTYAGIFAFFLFLLNTNPIISDKSNKTIEKIKIALIAPMPPQPKKITPPPVIPEPIIEQKPKKVVQKKAPVKKIIPVKKKIVQKKEVKKIVKEVKPQPIVQQKQIVQKDVIAKPVQPIAPITPKVDVTQIKNNFLMLLRKTINKNKFYPRVAQRRGIEGNVKVSFRIMNNGQVDAIKIVSGKRVFNKAVTQAIEKSFPIQIPKELQDFPMAVNLQLNFSLS